ncbi:MAG: hypothetical protein E6230_16885 [Paenibacillus dendritiformis]|uniref:hypothetical protein n=1 Tax=uncultured Paenibacillus sp. TaxID=227322 RepID=UPI0025E4F2D8|nr:hypothetical protein [uncultured Paenibacillus sp.]MDU5143844.1 hypothetical protein [Paenibacillus dendritiformis]
MSRGQCGVRVRDPLGGRACESETRSADRVCRERDAGWEECLAWASSSVWAEPSERIVSGGSGLAGCGFRVRRGG